MVDPTADPGALDDADLGVVDALRELKHEVDLLRGRLTALEGMQADLSDAVYRRVHEDYARRLGELDTRIAPLRAQARLAYAGLRERIEAIQHAYASIQLDRQEVELRHQLGEYDAAARSERLGTIDAALRERSIAQDRAEALRARFLEVFESEADLEAAPPAAAAAVPDVPRDAPARPALSLVEEPALDDELAALALDASMLAQIPEPVAANAPVEPAPVPREDTAPAHVDAAVTQILQVLDMPDLPTMPPAPPATAPAPAARPAPAAASRPAAEARPDPAVAVTTIGIATPPPAPASPAGAPGPSAVAATSGSTMFLRTARLVPQNVEAGRAAIPLPPKPVTLGGDAGSDIRVGGPGVEAQHARIEANHQGYVLTDLDSRHGTRVNAEPIRERLLRHEDVIQIGAARYVFREG